MSVRNSFEFGSSRPKLRVINGLVDVAFFYPAVFKRIRNSGHKDSAMSVLNALAIDLLAELDGGLDSGRISIDYYSNFIGVFGYKKSVFNKAGDVRKFYHELWGLVYNLSFGRVQKSMRTLWEGVSKSCRSDNKDAFLSLIYQYSEMWSFDVGAGVQAQASMFNHNYFELGFDVLIDYYRDDDGRVKEPFVFFCPAWDTQLDDLESVSISLAIGDLDSVRIHYDGKDVSVSNLLIMLLDGHG